MGENATPKDRGSDRDQRKKGAASPQGQGHSSDQGSPPPKPKRRKVNHACLYCRRSHMTCDLERPCTRCIKRNIGHLCHDEPREPAKRNSTGDGADHTMTGNGNSEAQGNLPAARMLPVQLDQQRQVDQQLLQENAMNITPARPGAAVTLDSLNPGVNSVLNPNDWRFRTQNQFQEMHNLHPYLFNAPEVTNEYTLLNDFLSTSLLDDGGMYVGGDGANNAYPDAALGENLATSTAAPLNAATTAAASARPVQPQLAPPVLAIPASSGKRAASVAPPMDKAQEAYYLTAADPEGNDAPDARINALLQAKYDAGMLRPFNYVKGYARLNRYMEQHMAQESRQKILRQLDKFRPKFRERMHSLTDVELVLVEMWFERCLMEYDRVFASMAVPACCWRRTGEIFRGNKEMAELIHVPIESLRDGKLAIHDIIVEEHLVSYWQKFGAIAFDSSQKAMLTSCSLKNPDLHSHDREIPCCFSFTIRRDEHNIPSLIVGNFLPMDVPKG